MQEKLPIAIISPHGGLAIPPELHGRVALNKEQIFNEADAYADELFDFRDHVLYFETFPYSRALLDVNRPADPALVHRPADGVVKRKTGYGDPVFYPGMEPDAELEQALIDRYWQSWHDRLGVIEHDRRVMLVFDCHSMAAVGPTAYDDPAQLRPRLEVANLGDEYGIMVPLRGKLSAPADVANFLAEVWSERLRDIPPLTATGPVAALNRPFWGGWDLMAHGHDGQPWLMVELNRALYIGDQSSTSPIVPLDRARLALLRERTWQAFAAVTAYVLSRS